MKTAKDGWVSYEYGWRFLPAVWFVVFIPLVSLLGITWVLRDGWQGGITFLLVSLSFVLLIGWVLLLALSDISINDEGIYRTAYGLTWQKMKWSDVVKLRVSKSMNSQSGRPTCSYVLVSAKGSGTWVSRRITFQERDQGMSELLSKMKLYLAQNNVPITDVSGQ